MLADDQIELRVGLVRIGLVFEAALVDPDVTGLAAVHACQRRIEVAAVELGDDDLRNGRDVRQHQPGHRLHDVILDPLVQKIPLTAHDAQGFLTFDHPRLDFGDFVLDPVALRLFCQEHRFQFVGLSLKSVQMDLLVFGGMFELNGMVVLVPRGFDLAADDAQGVLRVAGADFRRSKVGFQPGQPGTPFPAVHVGLRGLQSRQCLPICGVVGQAFFFGPQGFGRLVVGDHRELGLVFLPRTTRNRIVPYRPDRADQQQGDAEQEYPAVRFFSVVHFSSCHSLVPGKPVQAATRVSR